MFPFVDNKQALSLGVAMSGSVESAARHAADCSALRLGGSAADRKPPCRLPHGSTRKPA